MPANVAALTVNLGKRFGRRSRVSAESPLLSDSSMFCSSLLKLYGSAKADTVLVGHKKHPGFLTYSIRFFDGKWHE